MTGRHGSWQVRQWAPTALSAAVALVPAGSLLVAVGAASGGYLLQRADLAAAGAGVAVLGLVAERSQARALRRRSRRERWEHRAAHTEHDRLTADLRRELADAHHTLTVLRSRITVLQSRVAAADRLPLTELAVRQRQARELSRVVVRDDAPTMPLRGVPGSGRRVLAGLAVAPADDAPTIPLPRPIGPVHPSPRNPVVQPGAAGRPTPAEPARRRPTVTFGHPHGLPPTPAVPGAVEPVPAMSGPEPERPGDGVRPPVPALQRPPTPEGAGPAPGAGPLLPISLGPLAEPPHLPVLPLGPAESVATRGHSAPLLPPGPRDPASGPLAILVDRARRPRPEPEPEPDPGDRGIDARVYAALLEAEADELTRALERPGDPVRAGRHAGVAGWDRVTPSGLVVPDSVDGAGRRCRGGQHSA